MRIIDVIKHSVDIRHMLDHIGVQAEPTNIAPLRVPPLWEGNDACTHAVRFIIRRSSFLLPNRLVA